MKIELKVSGEREQAARLVRLGERATQARAVLSEVAETVFDEARRRFESEGRHGPGRWKLDRPATVRRKERQGKDPRTLHRSGALAASLSRRGAANQILRIGEDRLEIGTTLFYAHMHDKPKPGSHLPRRRLVTLSRPVRAGITGRIETWLLEGSDPE